LDTSAVFTQGRQLTIRSVQVDAQQQHEPLDFGSEAAKQDEDVG
jgi:hypothetical protein